MAKGRTIKRPRGATEIANQINTGGPSHSNGELRHNQPQPAAFLAVLRAEPPAAHAARLSSVTECAETEAQLKDIIKECEALSQAVAQRRRGLQFNGAGASLGGQVAVIKFEPGICEDDPLNG